MVLCSPPQAIAAAAKDKRELTFGEYKRAMKGLLQRAKLTSQDEDGLDEVSRRPCVFLCMCMCVCELVCVCVCVCDYEMCVCEMCARTRIWRICLTLLMWTRRTK